LREQYPSETAESPFQISLGTAQLFLQFLLDGEEINSEKWASLPVSRWHSPVAVSSLQSGKSKPSKTMARPLSATELRKLLRCLYFALVSRWIFCGRTFSSRVGNRKESHRDTDAKTESPEKRTQHAETFTVCGARALLFIFCPAIPGAGSHAVPTAPTRFTPQNGRKLASS
jgi:hypothetical protein